MNRARAVLVCVDCSDQGLREEITSAMLRMGHRVQFSVYAVVGTPVMLAELNRDLRRLAARGAHIVMVDLGLSAVAAVSVTEFGAPLARNRSVLRSVEVPRGWV